MHILMCGDQGFLCWQETEDGAEIVAIHSLPESWGTGLGHAMLTEALKQIGNRPVHLWAFKENTRARRFYEKHGFRWDGTERISEFDGALEVRYVKPIEVRFMSFSDESYQAVCDFLIALNSEKNISTGTGHGGSGCMPTPIATGRSYIPSAFGWMEIQLWAQPFMICSTAKPFAVCWTDMIAYCQRFWNMPMAI